MSRVALLTVVLLGWSAAARASDLPPGAVLRLGDNSFRTGHGAGGLLLSPDGSQYATWIQTDGRLTVTTWDSETGRPVLSRDVNGELFQGFAWGKGGAVAIINSVERQENRKAKLRADDFRVWDFTDPKAAPPPFLERNLELGSSGYGLAKLDRPKGEPQFTVFALSRDGTRAAGILNSADGKRWTVEVFALQPTSSAARLKRVRSIDLGTECPGWPLFSADGSVIVFGRPILDLAKYAFELRAWDLDSGKTGEAFTCHSPAALTAISPDGKLLALANESDEIVLVDVMTGKKRSGLSAAALPAGEGGEAEGGRVFTPDGKRLVVSAGRSAQVIDVASGKAVGNLSGHACNLCAVAVSADGKRIATADIDGLVRLWDANSFRPLNTVTGHRSAIKHAELSADGKRLLTWAGDLTLRVWDMKTGKELRAFANVPARIGAGYASSLPQQPTFTPDGLAVVFCTQDTLTARDVLTGLEVPLPGALAKLKSAHATFAPDGKAVLTWSVGDGELAVWDWPSGKKRFGTDVREPDAPGFSPDGAVVYASATAAERWDAKTGKVLPAAWKESEHLASATLGLRPNPRLLVSASDNVRRPSVIGAGSGKPLPEYRLVSSDDPDAPPLNWFVALSPDHRQFAGGLVQNEPFEVRIYESATGKVRRRLPVPRGDTYVLGFTPAGTKLLTASADHTILVWDVRVQTMPLPDAVKRETSATKLWQMLTTGKSDEAYLAMARFATEPDTAVKMAQLKLAPVAAPSAATLDRILRDLSDGAFAQREAASKELDAYGEAAVAGVKERFAKLQSPESRSRTEAFVMKWTGNGAEAARLADLRAIELLESLDTTESRTLLKQLAGGAPAAFRTQEAKRALDRHK